MGPARRRPGALVLALLLLGLAQTGHGPTGRHATLVADTTPTAREAAIPLTERSSRTRAPVMGNVTRLRSPGAHAVASTAFPADTGTPSLAVDGASADTVTRSPARRSPATSRLRRTDPSVARSGRATAVVEIPLPDGATVAYRVEPRDGVRLFAAAEGTLAAFDGRALLPLTFGLPASVVAGRFEAGLVHVVLPDGGLATHPVVVEIEPFRRLTVALAEDRYTVTPGGVVDVEVRAANEGNVRDTLRLDVVLPSGWALREPLPSREIEPGATATVVVRLAAPAVTGASGSAAIARISAATSERPVSHPVRLVTVGGDGPVSGLAHVPASVFVGSTSAEAGAPVMALTAEGEALPGTKMTLAFRSYDRLAQPVAFRKDMVGPRLHLGLESESWWLRLGDRFGLPDRLTGSALPSRGGAAGWRDERRSLELSVARPTSSGTELEEGLIVQARGETAAPVGRLSLALSSVDHTPAFGGAYTLRALGAGYTLEGRGHRLGVEAGVLEARDSAGRRTGPMVDARYQFSGADTRFGLQLRRVPTTVQRTTSYGNELSFTGSQALGEAVTVTGWGYQRSAPRLGGGESSSLAGGAGLRFQLPAGSHLQLQGMARRAERENGPTSETRTLRAGLDLPVGPISLELDADVGTVEQGGEAPFRNARAGVRWSQGTSHLRATAAYHDDAGFNAPYTAVDLSGNVELGPARIFGGVGARLRGLPVSKAVTLWTGSDVTLTPTTGLALGLDYTPSGAASGFRLSLGLSHRLRLPLPLPRQPVLQGVIFEDLDGNRALDPGEPAQAGVVVGYGPFRARTDADGRFAFFDAAPDGPRLDHASLPAELVLPVDVFLPSRGRVEIPLIRPGTLDLELFLDRDGDREWDSAERPAEHATATLRDLHGRERHAVADLNGAVRFGGLESGSYTLTVRAGEDAGQATELQLEVTPGTRQTIRLAVPAHRREIRSPGAPLRLLQDVSSAREDVPEGR